MKLGTENRNKTIMAGVAGVFALFALFYLYEQFFGGPSTPAPQTAAVATPAPARPSSGGAAKSGAASSSKLDPTLHMQAMLVSESLEYSGTGRNIFSAQSAPPPVAIPQAKAPARPSAQAQAQLVSHGPPPPPPIDLKLFGIETAQDGQRQGCFLHGEDVFCVAPGGELLHRYKVLSIDAKSAQVEDTLNSNKQTLPLLLN